MHTAVEFTTISSQVPLGPVSHWQCDAEGYEVRALALSSCVAGEKQANLARTAF